jgi:hypothetical protein
VCVSALRIEILKDSGLHTENHSNESK